MRSALSSASAYCGAIISPAQGPQQDHSAADTDPRTDAITPINFAPKLLNGTHTLSHQTLHHLLRGGTLSTQEVRHGDRADERLKNRW
jgi:hypothetical protein